jgi:hypothetical protein
VRRGADASLIARPVEQPFIYGGFNLTGRETFGVLIVPLEGVDSNKGRSR